MQPQMPPSASNGQEMASLEFGDASSSPPARTTGKRRRFTWKAPAIFLGFELLESIAFSGVTLNLVVYLGTVLHGTTAFNAAHVDTWNGTTFIVPVVGAFLADSCWGKYNTIVASLLFYLAVGPGAPHPVCGDLAAPAVVVPGDLVPAGDRDPVLRLLPGALPDLHRHRGRQVGAASVGGRAVRREQPGGEAEEAVFLHLVLRRHQSRHLRGQDARVAGAAERVLGARLRGRHALPAPGGAGLPGRHAVVQGAAPDGQPAQGHTQGAGGLPEEEEDEAACGSWWPSSARGGRRVSVSEAGAHQRTEVAGQGRREGHRGRRPVGCVHAERGGGREDPLAHGAHLGDVRVVRGVPGADDDHLHPAGDGHGQPALREVQGAGGVHGAGGGGLHAPLGAAARRRSHAARQEMGTSWEWRSVAAAADGRGAVPGAFGDGDGGVGGEAAAARRRRRQDDGHRVAGAAVPADGGIGRVLRDRAVEFFYGEAPASMRSICSALSILALSLGFYVNSVVVTAVAAVRPGWLAPDLNAGHLDYYFWLWTVIGAGSVLLYMLLAARYTPKQVLHSAS